MQTKIVEGVWGNSIAADYRRSKLPAKIVYWAIIVLLDAVTLAAFAIGSWVLGNTLFA